MGRKETMPTPYTGWGVLRMLIYSVSPSGRRHWGGYAIHGTDQPSSIGKEASHGCVRMFNEDVLKLSSETEPSESLAKCPGSERRCESIGVVARVTG